MLKQAGLRVVTARDTAAVLHALGTDPVTSCMVAARVEQHGLDPQHLHGELWTLGRPDSSLCWSGTNLIPLSGTPLALRAFADRALHRPRTCSSLVGPASLVVPLWEHLEHGWGPARELRNAQPLLALHTPPRTAPDPHVRQVRVRELEAYLPSAVAMFTEEVGVDPRGSDGGRAYRQRVADLVAAGRAWARFVDGEVVFKAEVGSVSSLTGQIQGVWVHPDHRGRGYGTAGTATVAQHVRATGRVPSLYVNDYNTAARASYARIGFTQVGTFATVLFS